MLQFLSKILVIFAITMKSTGKFEKEIAYVGTICDPGEILLIKFFFI